jgi:hypothetical protein
VNLSLVFIVNDAHCNPVVDADWKRYVSRAKRLDLHDATLRADFTTYEYVESKKLIHYGNNDKDDEKYNEHYNKLVKGKFHIKQKIIILETRDLHKLAKDVREECNTYIHNIKCDNYSNLVNTFEHPISKQIYMSSLQHDQRKKLCEGLNKIIQCDKLKFVNQSYTQIANDWLEIKNNSPPKSDYSPQLREILLKYRFAPYIARCAEKYKQSELESLDTIRCWTLLIIENPCDWPIFSAMDEVRPFTYEGKVLPPGLYYVSKTFKMGKGTIVVHRNWLPHCLVQYAERKVH